MKKTLIFGIMVVAATVGLTSCEADKEPVFTEATEFVLNTPPFADQLYQLAPNSVIELTCSQPNYGMALAPSYGVEVSLLKNFGENLEAPAEDAAPYYVALQVVDPQDARMQIEEKSLAEAMCLMMGLNEDNYKDREIPVVPVYVRATAHINNQPATRITSNIITLSQVLTYFQGQTVSLDVLYTPGSSNGWNQEKSQQLLAYEEGKYRGFVYLDGEFKFTNQPDWNGTNYGVADEAGQLSTDGGAGNLKIDGEPGLYWADVDITALTYKLTRIESVGVVGGYNGWSQTSADTHMTPSSDFLIWTFESDVEGEFKFVFNDDWSLNYGGTLEELVYDGPNISVGSVTKITLDLSKLPYTATAE